ncbi:glutamate-rich protein 3 isoform X1 [Cavia porcellus]|uniref:glutamate-rich protein 3 isoform X1 n=3 Tax=Cavia porcellus TaxID=10141 RepID=UPI002FE38AA7
MSLSHPAGLLAAYNSLTDRHLAGYFNNTRIRRHLLRAGLITRSGRILSEKEYKLNIMKRDHQKYIRECLAQAIFHKVLDMERYHQLEIKRKLETLARKERIQRFKGEHTRHSVQNNMPILSPHPPAGPKMHRGPSILVNEGHSGPLTLTAPRPCTAPGNMQPPIRLQPLPSNPAVATVSKPTLGSRSKSSLLRKEAPFPIEGKKAMKKFRNSTEKSQRLNPYQLPNMNSCLIPFPPPTPPPNRKVQRESKSETWKGRRFRPTTATNGLEPLFTRDSGRIYKTSLHSNAAITMIYLGKNVHLSYDDPYFRDEIKVYQQHCGGENLCVYKGKLLEKETFQFISKRHYGFPFSLTFFVNGMQVNRLSSCCEYKHRKGSRLGGRRSYFGFVSVEKASPCYKCIIAMGLDKKPSLLKPRKDKSSEDRMNLRNGEQSLGGPVVNWMPRRTETEQNKTSVSASFSVEDIKPEVKEVRTAVEEMECKRKSGQDVWEDSQGDTFKYEYEEDFEVDDEKQDEKANEEGQADDQMNGISKSPSEDEKDNLGPEEESAISPQKAPDADDSEKDEDDGCSESELDEDKQDTRSISSTSSRSFPCSSDSEDDSAELGREAHAEHSMEEDARSSSSRELSEDDEPRKSHLRTKEFFETELEDQEIRKADVETIPLPTEESCGNILKGEMERGTQGMTEHSSEKSRKNACEEEKEKAQGQLWRGSPAKAEARRAGVLGVEKGASIRNLVMEERAVLNSNKESKQITQEAHALEKAETEADTGSQYQDADLMEDEKVAVHQEKAGANEFPWGEWKPTAEQPVSAEQLLVAREIPVDLASEAETDAGEDGRLRREELDHTGKAEARDSASLSGEGTAEDQVLRQTENEASPTEEQGSEKTVLPDSTVQSSQHPQEEVILRESGIPEMGEADKEVAVSKTELERPDVDGSVEKTPTELEDMAPVEDTESLKEDEAEQETLGKVESDKEGRKVLEAETPLSFSTEEAEMEAGPMRASDGSSVDLPKETIKREETVTELVPNREDDKEDVLPEQLGVAKDRRKGERPTASLRETESEKKVVTWADAQKDEDTLKEEQKLKEEKRETMKDTRSEELANALRNEKESDAEDVEPTEATESNEGTELLEDAPAGKVVSLLDATTEFEKTPGKETVLKEEEGEEGLREARDTEQQGQEPVAPSKQGEGAGYRGQGTSEGPGNESLDERKVPERIIPDIGWAEECTALDHGGLAGLARGDEEGSQQGPEGTQAMVVTHELVPEGGGRMAKKFNVEAEGEDFEEDGDRKSWLETGEIEDCSPERNEATGERTVNAEEQKREAGTAVGRKEVMADLKTAEGKTVANTATSSSDAAEEETRLKGSEGLGETAAEETVVAEETTLSRQEVTVASTEKAGARVLPEPSKGARETRRLEQDREGGEAEATQRARSAQAMAGPGGGDPGQVTGVSEESSQDRASEPSRGSPEVVALLPVKSDLSGTREKQEHMVQRHGDSADAP